MTLLFLIDALTFLVFAVVLLVPEPDVAHDADDGRIGYLDVLRDRIFLGLMALNVVFVAAGYAAFELLPVFAKNEAGVSERGIGSSS